MPFPTLSITYRTTGAWGSGAGADLTPGQVDTNFYRLKTAIEYLRDNPPSAVGLLGFTQSGDQITPVFTDSSTGTPITLPKIAFNFTGSWAPSHAYAAGDAFSINSGVYVVLLAHTSAGSFDRSTPITGDTGVRSRNARTREAVGDGSRPAAARNVISAMRNGIAASRGSVRAIDCWLTLRYSLSGCRARCSAAMHTLAHSRSSTRPNSAESSSSSSGARSE